MLRISSDEAGWKICEQMHPNTCVWDTKICKKAIQFSLTSILIRFDVGGYPHTVKLHKYEFILLAAVIGAEFLF